MQQAVARRVRAACAVCQRRKLKCDGKQPCSRCARTDRICRYAKVQVQTQMPARASVVPRANVPVGLGRGSPWLGFSFSKFRFHRRYQDVLPFYFCESVLAQLPESVVAAEDLQLPSVQNYGWNLAGGAFLAFALQPSATRPPLRELRPLVQHYFDHVNPLFSIVNERVFWSQWDSAADANSLFNAIGYLMAITAERYRCGPPPRVDETALFNHSYAVVSEFSFEWESVELIQSWLLIAAYLRCCYRQTSCYAALARAVAMCRGMSLNLEAKPEQVDAEGEQTGALHSTGKYYHCFWTVYTVDKIFSHQLGKVGSCPISITKLKPPGPQQQDEWFQGGSLEMLQLALIIDELQQCGEDQEVGPTETIVLRDKLHQWYTDHARGPARDTVLQLQPTLTYLDVKLTWELRTLFPLLSPTKQVADWPISLLQPVPMDYHGLLETCQATAALVKRLVHRGEFGTPWWSHLSLLFTCSLACIVLVSCGVQQRQYAAVLAELMELWQELEGNPPENQPVMLKQCYWCIKMVNKFGVLKLQQATVVLQETVPKPQSDHSPNKHHFKQFGRVDDEVDNENTPAPSPPQQQDQQQQQHAAESIADELLQTLQWFDQHF
ncbi:Stb4p KNAG_0M02120 [Huiozyma naganishii CBS 8797]|uniref:Zn(2)-C6 fungal-type domain-containing protein n=1 Tax=Huiozyma naganishii (strain ATCC MYA-139 / BCRC 22969 / CBS 8797 / KCTC 17520 / NBRC 10181 / NCYC 3082 / Yp74L-3) TaxID=1071383 RepID=J7RDZ9_HUIN7|nr:hypothetical protein KNAG_0M02120 [Kazachstania naganishii CBS 8797]CCK73065.1 hypothetical protein KNAG_0M02120 [Kazachstania naganishii CBS 8797]